MTWWVWSMIFVILGAAGFYYFEKRAGNYDIGNHMLQWASLIVGLSVAITICICKFFLN